LNVVLTVIPAAILWFGYDQLSYGLLQLGAGILLGEAALFRQPTNLSTSTPPGVTRGLLAQARSRALALTITF
jgi:hypothetical protein